MEGAIFIGNSTPVGGTELDVGISLRLFGRINREGTELSVGFVSSELLNKTNPVENSASVVQTNASFAARVQVPRDFQVLILSRRQEGEGSPICVLLSLQ